MKKDMGRVVCSVLVIGLFVHFCGCVSPDKAAGGKGARAVRILCIGDSITYSGGLEGGFKGPLREMLAADGIECELMYDGDGGRRLEWMLKDKRGVAAQALADNPDPDVILLLIGINDLIVNRNTIEVTLVRLGKFVDELAELAPDARIVVGSLVPNAADDPVLGYDPAGSYVNSEDKVVAFNQKLPATIAKKRADGIDVEWVDFHSRMTREDLSDGIHPNEKGYAKMAAVWFEAVKSYAQGSASGLCCGSISLNRAVIVVDGSKSVHARAADMLADEIEKRSGVRLAIVESAAEDAAAIVLGTTQSLNDSGLLSKGSTVPSKAEGYGIWVDTARSKGARVILAGHDDRGVLFAAGRLIRLLRFGTSGVRIGVNVRVATAPRYPIRGHQLGYRGLNNAYDTWDVETYEQYIREVVMFGTNSIELIPRLDPKKKPSHHMSKSMWEMNVELSKMLDSYGLDVWIWLKVSYSEIKNPQVEKEAMAKRRALFESFERLDSLFVPGGDGGDSPPEVLMPWLGRLSKVLREVHPNAKVWVSNQVFEFEENDFFFEYLRTEQPDWLEGVVYGPWTKIPIPEVRARMPKRYKIRRYPDISHCLGCQYPVPEWDRAFGLTHGREPVCPRPREMTHIHNAFAPLTEGFITYSDGVNEDLNKFVWSALGWDDRADTKDILREYGKAFFGDEYAEAVAEGLLMLEDNWHGPIVENDGIEKTLSHWQKIADTGGEELAGNWRMQLYLFRACYDAYLRRRVILESNYEQQALNALKIAGQTGAAAAIEKARGKLAQIDSSPPAPELRRQIETLGLELFESIGFQTSVKEPFFASGPRRGNVLDYLDRPLNDRLWLEAEFEKVLAIEAEAGRLAYLDRIVNWEDAGEGGFYDDLGAPGRQPHLVRQKTWSEDPQMMRTPIDEHYYTKQVTAHRLSWLDQGHIRYSMGLHPDEDKLTLAQKHRIEVEDLPHLTMRYDQLDPEAKYRVRVTYSGRFRPQSRLVADGKYQVHGALVQSDPTEPVEFDVPVEATADGNLKLEWELLNNARGCQVAEVWLLKQQ